RGDSRGRAGSAEHGRAARCARRGAGGDQHVRRLHGARADSGDVQEERAEGEEPLMLAISANQLALLYLFASVLFILALTGRSHPLSARRRNRFGIAGIAIAILVTLAI